MEDLRDKRKKLLGIKKLIMNMSDNVEKAKLLRSYIFLLKSYLETGIIKDDEIEFGIEQEFLDKYDKKVLSCTKQKLWELNDVVPYLYKEFDSIIHEYKKNDFCSYENELWNRVNLNKLYGLVEEFFDSLGSDVKNLYNEMDKHNNILLVDNPKHLGESEDVQNIDNPYIIIQNIENYFLYYFTLVHEMGHCYQFYLQRNHLHLESFNLFTEVTSTLFEKMFASFLQKKHLFQQELHNIDLENHIYFLNSISASKILCNLFMNNEFLYINPYNLSYGSRVPLEELKKLMRKDCGYILSNKKDIEFMEFYYSIGEIIASYFMKRIEEDFQTGWQEFKNFISTVDNYSLEEILNKYMDTNLIKENIKTFIKSYRTR